MQTYEQVSNPRIEAVQISRETLLGIVELLNSENGPSSMKWSLSNEQLDFNYPSYTAYGNKGDYVVKTPTGFIIVGREVFESTYAVVST